MNVHSSFAIDLARASVADRIADAEHRRLLRSVRAGRERRHVAAPLARRLRSFARRIRAAATPALPGRVSELRH